MISVCLSSGETRRPNPNQAPEYTADIQGETGEMYTTPIAELSKELK